jgi:hypothetical protein
MRDEHSHMSRGNSIMQCVKTVESLVGKPAHVLEGEILPPVKDLHQVEVRKGAFVDVVASMLHGTGVQLSQLSQRTIEQLEHQHQHRQAA